MFGKRKEFWRVYALRRYEKAVEQARERYNPNNKTFNESLGEELDNELWAIEFVGLPKGTEPYWLPRRIIKEILRTTFSACLISDKIGPPANDGLEYLVRRYSSKL